MIERQLRDLIRIVSLTLLSLLVVPLASSSVAWGGERRNVSVLSPDGKNEITADSPAEGNKRACQAATGPPRSGEIRCKRSLERDDSWDRGGGDGSGFNVFARSKAEHHGRELADG
jgi:hypothetical protein